MKPPELFLQKQPTSITCVQACLAMALNVNVQKVILTFGERSMNQQALTCALTQCGIVWNQFTMGTLMFDGWYFAVVPSLNHVGGNHQVLLCWEHETGKLKVLDPAIARTYKEDGSDLVSWEGLTAFLPGGKLPDWVARDSVTYEK